MEDLYFSHLICSLGSKLWFYSVGQVCHQAAGGCRVLCGGRHQQRSASAGCGDEQSQPRAAETDERAEHPEAGPTRQHLQFSTHCEAEAPCGLMCNHVYRFLVS